MQKLRENDQQAIELIFDFNGQDMDEYEFAKLKLYSEDTSKTDERRKRK